MIYKKIYVAALLVASTLLATGCSEENQEREMVNTIKVEQVDMPFGSSAAAQGVIQIESASGSLKATSDADWCTVSVSGNKITVEVTKNDAFEGRNALITVTDGVSTIFIPVSQAGIKVSMEGEKSYTVALTENSTIIPVFLDGEYEIETSAEWIAGEYTPDGLVVTVAENDGPSRSASVTVKCHGKEASYKFSQINFVADISGTYTAQFISSPTETAVSKYDVEIEGEIDPDTGDTWFYVVGLPNGVEYLPLKFNTADASFTGEVGELVGIYANKYYVYTSLYGKRDGAAGAYLTWAVGQEYTLTSDYDTETFKISKIQLIDDGKWTGMHTLGIRFMALKTDQFASANSAGNIYSMCNFTLTRK